MCYNSRQTKEIKRRYKHYTLKQLENIKSNIQDSIDNKEAGKEDLYLLALINKEIELRESTQLNKSNGTVADWERRKQNMTQHEIDAEIRAVNNLCKYTYTLEASRIKTIADLKDFLIKYTCYNIKENDKIEVLKVDTRKGYILINKVKKLKLIRDFSKYTILYN